MREQSSPQTLLRSARATSPSVIKDLILFGIICAQPVAPVPVFGILDGSRTGRGFRLTAPGLLDSES
jgi:hypothetical protein